MDQLKIFKVNLTNYYSRHTILFYIFSFIIIFLSILAISKIYYFSSISLNSIKRTIIFSNSTDNYENLIKSQAKNNNKKSSNSNPEITKKEVLDEIEINFLLVKPKNISLHNISSLISNLKNSENKVFQDCKYSECKKNVSLNYIDTYLKNESEKYDVKNIKARIKINENVFDNDINKVGDFAYVWSKDPFAIIKLQDSFEKIISQNNLDKNKIYAFLFFDNSFEKSSDSREGSYYELKKFRSFADKDKKRIYINVYDFKPIMSRYVTETAAHETLHLFGATDKYNEDIQSTDACSEKGRGEPDKNPLFPQTNSDLMCTYIEYKRGVYKRANFIEGEVVINKFTASEIGWIN